MERICIVCPTGCLLELTEVGTELIVKGNKCPKGIEFAKQEWFNPMRMLTTTLRTDNEKLPRVSVRTSQLVPKEQMMAIMNDLDTVKVKLPVVMGQILVADILNLGVDIISTQTLKEE